MTHHLTLLHKLGREVWQARAQLIAIALVVSIGVMVLLMMTSAKQSLTRAQQHFYQDYHYAELFVELTRAPRSLSEQVLELPGVAIVEPRIRSAARVELPGYTDPIQAQLLSIPSQRDPLLNRLHFSSGYYPQTPQQVVISKPFAEAHQLQLYDSVTAILNGRRTELEIVGIAISPEFIYQIGPADIMPDYQRYGVFWLHEEALAAALDMDGAFNSISLQLQPGTDQEALKIRLDALFERYGGRGAADRDEQSSHRFLSEELKQLGTNAIFLPVLFLGASAFLFNIFMQRQIQTQRQTIAILKAFGYSQKAIFGHYLGYTVVVIFLGVVFGAILSRWLAAAMVELYSLYFNFVTLTVSIQWTTMAIALLVTLVAGFLGTWRAIYLAIRVPPAQAMRPATPINFHQSWINHLLASPWFTQGARIILRNLVRHPLRSGLTVFGIAISGGLLLFGSYQFNAITTMLERNYRVEQQMDVIVQFTQITDGQALASLAALPGVNYVEGFRSVPVRLRQGPQTYSTAVTAFSPDSQLRQLAGLARMPEQGIVLTEHLANYLGSPAGTLLDVEFIAERRIRTDVQVVATSAEAIGVGAYLSLATLNQQLYQSESLSGAWLLIDSQAKDALYTALNEMPQVAGYTHVREAEAKLRAYMDDTVLTAMSIIFVLAGSMTFAMVYNNARIALAERERELATLRVLGYSHTEIARILFGELFILVLLALPLGWGLGVLFALGMSHVISSELFRIPFVLSQQLFGWSALGVLTAATIAVMLMVRRLRRLDLIAALKSE